MPYSNKSFYLADSVSAVALVSSPGQVSHFDLNTCFSDGCDWGESTDLLLKHLLLLLVFHWPKQSCGRLYPTGSGAVWSSHVPGRSSLTNDQQSCRDTHSDALASILP